MEFNHIVHDFVDVNKMVEGVEEMSENLAGPRYGIWNGVKREFQFGINESTKGKAEKALFKKIGNDARKWRFEAKRLNK